MYKILFSRGFKIYEGLLFEKQLIGIHINRMADLEILDNLLSENKLT